MGQTSHVAMVSATSFYGIKVTKYLWRIQARVVQRRPDGAITARKLVALMASRQMRSAGAIVTLKPNAVAILILLVKSVL